MTTHARWLVAVLVAPLLVLAPTTAQVAADPIPPHPPSPLAGLPGDVNRGQVVNLADGDRYEVTFAESDQSIRGRRWHAATSSWGARQVIFNEPGLHCVDVEIRGSGTGVVATFGCGPDPSSDRARHPYTAVSADTEHWDWHRLPGYRWSSPAISPSGAHAVWSREGDYLTWSPTSGFVPRDASPAPDTGSYGVAPLITDDGTVTIAYADDTCSVTFDTYPSPGVPTRQVLPTHEGCVPAITSIDAHSVALGSGSSGDEWANSRLTRPAEVSPWVLSSRAPLSAPGLVGYSYEPDGPRPWLLDDPDGPLAAVVASDVDELGVQLFDPTAQSWLPPIRLFSRPAGTTCQFREDATTALGFYALHLGCAGPDRFVTSSDGGTWTTLPIRTQAIGVNRSSGLVAVADRRKTVIVGNDGSVTLPVGSSGGCDVVVPIASDRLLRLTATKNSSGWPVLLQRSTSKGWRTLHRVVMPTKGACRSVESSYGWVPNFELYGRGESASVRFKEVNGRWDVRIR